MTEPLAWTAEHAAAVRRVRPPRWLHPWVAGVGWALLLVATFVFANDDRPCSDIRPCGADWPGFALIVLWVAHVTWSVVGGRAALVTAPVLAVLAVVWRTREYPGVAASVLVPAVVVLTAASIGIALARARRLRAARQLANSQEPPCAPWPGPPPARGRAPLAVVALHGVAALALTGWTLWNARDEAGWERAATRVSARVTAHGGDGGIAVDAGNGTTWSFSTFDSSYYPVGSTVVVLVGPGRPPRLAAEPFDPTGWAALTALAALAAVTLVAAEAAVRRELRSFATVDQPMFAVQLGIGDDQAVVGTADAERAVVLVGPVTAGDVEDGRTAPAVCYGLPVGGEVVGFHTADDRLMPPTGRAKNASGILGADLDEEDDGLHAPLVDITTLHSERARRVAAAVSGESPVEIGAFPGRRSLGGLLVAGAVAGALLLVARPSIAAGDPMVPTAALAVLGFGYELLVAGTRVDQDGLVVRSVLRLRRFPWASLDGAGEANAVMVRTRAGKVVRVLDQPLWRARTKQELAAVLDARIRRARHENRTAESVPRLSTYQFAAALVVVLVCVAVVSRALR